jgi:hypothetical protein
MYNGLVKDSAALYVVTKAAKRSKKSKVSSQEVQKLQDTLAQVLGFFGLEIHEESQYKATIVRKTKETK